MASTNLQICAEFFQVIGIIVGVMGSRETGRHDFVPQKLIYSLQAEILALLGHFNLRWRKDYRVSVVPLKLDAKILYMCIFSGENIKGLKYLKVPIS